MNGITNRLGWKSSNQTQGSSTMDSDAGDSDGHSDFLSGDSICMYCQLYTFSFKFLIKML